VPFVLAELENRARTTNPTNRIEKIDCAQVSLLCQRVGGTDVDLSEGYVEILENLCQPLGKLQCYRRERKEIVCKSYQRGCWPCQKKGVENTAV
jgi:hypothetical protein